MTTLQEKVLTSYKRYKLPDVNPTFNEFCFPKHFTLQKPQLFLGEWSKKSYPGLLIYHKIGSGKTGTIINICNNWPNIKPIILMPASLIKNFRNELRKDFSNISFLTKDQKARLDKLSPNSMEYKAIIAASDDKIDKHYTLMSFNKFIISGLNIKTELLIIDEVQNVISQHGTFYSKITEYITKRNPKKVIVATANPIFDNPIELFLLLQLMRVPMRQDWKSHYIGQNGLLNKKSFIKEISGFVSYFKGAPNITFPKVTKEIEMCVMSKYQSDLYKRAAISEIGKRKIITKVGDSNDSFYVRSRQRSNIVFPENPITFEKMKKDLKKYSCKFASLINKIIKNKGHHFVYSNFTGRAGIESITGILDTFGYSNFAKAGPGKKRYAVWSGDVTQKYRDLVRNTFNSSQNDKYGRIEIIIGSPSIKEGVSLLRTCYCHIMEPYFNDSRQSQIMGRVIRFCSHKSLPLKNRFVKVWIYIASLKSKPKELLDSVDYHIYNMANEKLKINLTYEAALKAGALDKLLFQ